MMDTHMKGLVGLDKEWIIEHSWFRMALGDKGRQAVEKRWLHDVFPGKSLSHTLEKAFEKSKKSLTSDFFQFATTAAQSSVRGGHAILKTM
eukprot:6490979-Amphidinium_carterae.4